MGGFEASDFGAERAGICVTRSRPFSINQILSDRYPSPFFAAIIPLSISTTSLNPLTATLAPTA